MAGAESEQLFGIEDVVGGSGEDTLVAAETTSNRLDGGPGDDRLLGAMQGDQAFGGPGSDQCLGPFSVEDSCGLSGAGGGTRVELYESIAGSSSLAIAGDDQVDDVRVSLAGDSYVVSSPLGSPLLLGAHRGGCSAGAGRVRCARPVASILVSLGAGNDGLVVDGSVPAEVSVAIDGGPGSDWLRTGSGSDTLYAGDDGESDRLDGGGGDDALFGVNILHPRRGSGAATLVGGGGDDLLIGGQPCEGDFFHGGRGDNDSASFARVRNGGVFVEATIGGEVVDPDAADSCGVGRIDASVEKIEGSTGPDVLLGGAGPDTLLGRGGPDALDAGAGLDRCIGGRGSDRARRCEYVR